METLSLKAFLSFLLVFVLSQTRALSATLEQFWPWMAPNPLAMGASFAAVRDSHPSAIKLSNVDSKPGTPFDGDLAEALPDGSFFNYGFRNDQLESISWATPATSNTAEIVATIRKSLYSTCGEPAFGTTGRNKKRGGLARIIWEEYRSVIDPKYVITLRATSESGIEVDLFNEVAAKQRGIKTSHRTYEEVLKDDSHGIESDSKPDDFVDLLAAARAAAPQPGQAKPEGTVDKNGQEPPKTTGATELKPENPAPVKGNQAAGPPSSPALWWRAALGLLALALIVNIT